MAKQHWHARKYNLEKHPNIIRELGDVTDVYDHRGRLAHRFPASASEDSIRRFVKGKAGRDLDFLGRLP